MGYAELIAPGRRVRLAEIGAGATGGLDKAAGETRLAALADEIGELQELLYAAQTHALLVVLQGLDTSGKDGTIRHVFGALNPLGCRAVPFKVPTPQELAHDFLWRIHREAPGRGEVVLFNRSHYEDVLVARVHNLVPEPVWRRRYAHINAFEALLADADTVILKFYLHISKAEQERRLRAREREVEKAWKLSAGDWAERRHWDEYQAAYEDALSACSTDRAPWYVVPADHKWVRNLAVAEALVERLRPLRESWLATLAARGQAELAAIRREQRTGGGTPGQ